MSPIFLRFSLWTLSICILLILGYALYEKYYLRKKDAGPRPRELDAQWMLADALYALYRAGSRVNNWLWRLRHAHMKADTTCPVCGHHNFHSPVCIHRRDEGWIEQDMVDENSYQ
jgi:hypothetical protein